MTTIESPVADAPDIAPLAPVVGANEVHLIGRVSGISEPHELPSGDSVVTLRLVVPREVHRPRQPSVDTIDVACWSSDSQRGAAEVGVGGTAEVTGSLRRRFFRGAGGLQSRYEVEAHSVSPLPVSEVEPAPVPETGGE